MSLGQLWSNLVRCESHLEYFLLRNCIIYMNNCSASHVEQLFNNKLLINCEVEDIILS